MINRRELLQFAGGSLGTLGAGALPASAQLVNKYAEQLKNGEFNWFPERSASDPMLIIVSIPNQLVHVYRNGVRVAASTCSTGKTGHETPMGVFKILEKDKNHHSSTYNDAPMPNMNRLTWSGIALHAGKLPGYPASHGCVRLPLQFSDMLFGITQRGMTVVIADSNTFPAEVVHPGMVLGNYVRDEFLGVDTAIKKSEYIVGQIVKPKQTSVVVSAKDKKIQVFEDDTIVASGSIKIQDESRALAERVYTLHGVDEGKKDLHWSSIGYSNSDQVDANAELRRIEADAPVREQLRVRMHQSMTVLTTNGTAAKSNRSKGDFVIIEGLF